MVSSSDLPPPARASLDALVFIEQVQAFRSSCAFIPHLAFTSYGMCLNVTRARARRFGAEAVGLAIDHQRRLGWGVVAMQLQQRIEHRAREHVAAGGALVAQDAVEQQVVGRAAAQPEGGSRAAVSMEIACGLGRIRQDEQLSKTECVPSQGVPARPWAVEGGARLLPDKGRQRGKAHLGWMQPCASKTGAPRRAKRKPPPPCQFTAWLIPPLFARDHLLQPGQAVRGGVLAHFDADPAAAHLVRHGGRGAGAEEAVENQVAGVGCDMEDALEQPLGFGVPKLGVARKGYWLPSWLRLCDQPLPMATMSEGRHPGTSEKVANDVGLRIPVLAEVDPALAKQTLVGCSGMPNNVLLAGKTICRWA